MKYLKKFETTSQYEVYTADTANFIKPNVSLTVDNNTVYYNPWVETRVVAKFNVTDTSNPIQLCYNSTVNEFSAIEIDGVEQPSVVSAYTFTTTGEHTVKYTLTDPTRIPPSVFQDCSSLTFIIIPNSVTFIGGGAFGGCSSLTSVTISNSVWSISNSAFLGCSSLTSITIPNSVIEISKYAFRNCSSLTSIVSNATTAPTIESSTFQGVKTGGTLTVPIGSSGYNVWMGTGNYYLGKYGWTKVEQ